MENVNAAYKNALNRTALIAVLALVGALLMAVLAPRADAADIQGTSVLATWNCTTAASCPWGNQTDGQAAVWPAAAEPTRARHGYTVTHDVYAASAKVAGWKVTVTSGSAAVYSGTPSGSHSQVASLSTGQSFTLPVLPTGEVVSLQSGSTFGYTLTPGTPPTATPTPTPTTAPTTTATTPVGQSVLATWNCTTAASCPWGNQTDGHAAVWPAAAEPTRARHGYTVTHDVYGASAKVAGWKVTVNSGSASVYSGTPSGSHGQLASLTAGQSFTVPSLPTGEVVSLQGGSTFNYTLTPGTLPTTTAPPTTTTPTTSPTTAPTTTTPAGQSVLATWNCTGASCPWGNQTDGHAAIWPAAAEPTRARHGYTVSHDVYGASAKVAGWKVTLTSGSAAIYSGTPSGSHGQVASLSSGQSFTLPSLPTGEIVSLQGGSTFNYTLTPGTAPTTTTTTPPTTTTTTAPPTTTGPPACTDPTTCNPASWIASLWRCNAPGCTDADWTGGVLTWPSTMAYTSNGRAGASSRSVFSPSGQKLYPYMGAWANGCTVKVVSGDIIVIEWQRGTNTWRETWLTAGNTHTIHLTGAENGAMIETQNNAKPFQVSFTNCTPRTIDKGTSE